MLWNRLHLTSEGYLSACCVDYNLDLIYGNIINQSLEDLWNNLIMTELRNKHLKDELKNLLCDQCMNGKPEPFQPLTSVNKIIKSEIIRTKETNKLKNRFIQLQKVNK
jgi:hypothetical protein